MLRCTAGSGAGGAAERVSLREKVVAESMLFPERTCCGERGREALSQRQIVTV